MIVDAHQHFWAIARADYGWMEGNPKVDAIRRDFRPEHLDPIRQRLGIDRTVLVQAAPTVGETEYLLGIADAVPWVGKVVGWINFEDLTHLKHLERFADHSKFAGVRPMIQDIPDKDWMLKDEIQWAYEALIELDLSFDALGYPIHLENFQRLFERYPSLRTVVDHCMKPRIRDQAFDEWAQEIEAIAKYTPAYCKFSGLVTEAGASWSAAKLRPYAEHVLNSFGAERVMWGSDWPVLELAASYEEWWTAATELIGANADRKAIFGETATKFYRLS
jgi:L-fuconolactonase